jgi:hypothetical protein
LATLASDPSPIATDPVCVAEASRPSARDEAPLAELW